MTGTFACALPDLGVLAVSGADGKTWLQGMLTQDVLTLEPGTSRYAIALTIKGKALSDMQIALVEDRVLMVMPADRIDPLIEHLSKRFVIEDVVLERLPLQVVTLQGDRAATLAAGHNIIIPRSHHGSQGVDLLVDDAATTLEAVLAAGAESIDAETLDGLRIRAAIPKYGVDFDDATIPIEAGLVDAIHWSKGCYLGQEVIARIAHRGHTNKELRLLNVASNDTLQSGAAVFAPDNHDKAIGRIKSATAGAALALVRRKWFDAGTTVDVEHDEGFVAAVVDGRRMRAHVDLLPENDPGITRNAKQTGMLR